jgi:hypothetical protein
VTPIHEEGDGLMLYEQLTIRLGPDLLLCYLQIVATRFLCNFIVSYWTPVSLSLVYLVETIAFPLFHFERLKPFKPRRSHTQMSA